MLTSAACITLLCRYDEKLMLHSPDSRLTMHLAPTLQVAVVTVGHDMSRLMFSGWVWGCFGKWTHSSFPRRAVYACRDHPLQSRRAHSYTTKVMSTWNGVNLDNYCCANQSKALKRNVLAENIGVLLCNAIGTGIKKIDDEVFEGRMGEVPCFPLKTVRVFRKEVWAYIFIDTAPQKHWFVQKYGGSSFSLCDVSQSAVLGQFYNPNTTPKDKERVVVCLRRTGQELHWKGYYTKGIDAAKEQRFL